MSSYHVTCAKNQVSCRDEKREFSSSGKGYLPGTCIDHLSNEVNILPEGYSAPITSTCTTTVHLRSTPDLKERKINIAKSD